MNYIPKIIFCSLLTVLLFTGISSAPDTKPAEGLQSVSMETGTNDDRPLAIVRRFRPVVVVKQSAQIEWADARMTQPLFDRDTLRTGPEGYALIQFMDNSLARVRPNSLLIIRGETRDRGSTFSRITLEVGEIFLNVNGNRSNYEIQTRTAVASVKGTSFNTKIEDDFSTVFTGVSGEVEIMALTSGQAVILTRRNRVRVDQRGETITLENISSSELQNLQQQYDDLEEGTRPDIMRLRFMNRSGQTREIDIRYFETD